MTGNMIGRVFNNRYQITERIGIGGMAEVYRAQDNVLGRLVAVKVMLPQYAADESFTQRFKQEAASAANLQSPYIVNVYDWGQDEGTYYIVMEYVRGSDLKTAINQRGAINQRKVAEIGSQVCQALSVAHGLDIIHRDIKPQNIMVQPDGNVKVMDFGIARAKNSTKEQTSSVLGTAHYISPEQAQGKELTAASDIYSLGIVLYESATGKLPFDGPDAVSVAMKQVQRSALNDYLAGRPVALGAGFTGAQTQIMGGVPNIGPMPDGTAVMPAVGGASQHGGSSQNHSYMSDNTAPKKKGKKVAAVVAAIAAVVALVAIAAFALGGNSSGEQIEVPDVTGQTLDQAKTAIQSAGFKVGNVTQSYSDSVESGKVVSQDPAAKTKKAKGSTINLTVSQGRQEIEVPDLVGKTADEAKKLLQANGLKYKAGTAEYSDSVDKDRIARQDVAAGSKVAKDTVVTYYLSLGSEGTSVPDVVGQTRSSATATLNNAGFYVTVDQQYSDTVEEGVVISQTPSSGSKLKAEGTVNIVVSKGKESKAVSVPSVVGQSEGSAMTTLNNAGFKVTTEYQTSTSVTSGSVISQTPTAGSELDPGKTVHLVISTGSGSSTNGSSNGSSTNGGSESSTNGGSTTNGGSSSSY